MADPIPALQKLGQALHPLPGAAQDGGHRMDISGTVNTIGGGTGGTSMIDNNPFTPGGTSITPIGGYFGGRTIGSGNAAAPALSGSAILQVHVVAGGAGGGLAQMQVVGSDNQNFNNVGFPSGGSASINSVPVNIMAGATVTVTGTVNTVGGGGGGFASAAVYGSPAFPVYNVGSVNVVNAVGVFGSMSVTGSVNITGSINPVGIFGSLGALTGSVSVGGQPIVVDVRGSAVPTQWAIQLGASGPNVLFNAPGAGAIKLYGLTMIANATVTYRLQSPSGTDLTGSITLLPGAGVVELAPIRDPIYTGAAVATWNLWLSSAVAVGGIARGWIE